MKHLIVLIVALLPTLGWSQTTQSAAVDPNAAITLLRNDLVDAFNKSDVDRLLTHLDPEVVVTWQNGEVCRGPAAVRAYYEKMMRAPNHIVASISVHPEVDGRHIFGDWAVSTGNLGDQYVLSDGSSFKFDSRFTATIARHGEEWKITSFHASVNAFDNPILKIAEKKAGTWAGIGAGVVGLIVGGVIGGMIARRRPKAAA